jgi:L-threonylcarbamoyladenylate synthase
MLMRYFLARDIREEDFQEIRRLLIQGEVIGFPTETVYGLGVDWKNDAAIEKLFNLKNRPANNPMTLHVSSTLVVKELAVEIPPSFYELASIFWPGPLTIVLKKAPCISSKISRGETVGVRMPKQELALLLIEKMGGILLGTSANLSGKPPASSAEEVGLVFAGKIAALIDGGVVFCNKASTVISLAEDPPRLFREGPISKERIEKILGKKIQR